MNKKEKQLLLNDLCGRLPYGVKVSVSGDDFDNYQYPYLLTAISKFGQDILCKVYSPIYIPLGCPSIENIKPYLRPMSSMTEQEKNLLNVACGFLSRVINTTSINSIAKISSALILICYEHHLDINGLIPKGLALEAPEGMYKNVAKLENKLF